MTLSRRWAKLLAAAFLTWRRRGLVLLAGYDPHRLHHPRDYLPLTSGSRAVIYPME